MILGNPSNPRFVEDVRSSFAKQTAMDLIGAKLGRVEPGFVEVTVRYRSDLAQQNGYLHGGIVATIADTACGYAAYTLMPPGAEVLAVEFKLNLLRPAKGEDFLARAEVLKSGKTLTVVRADVFSVSQEGKEQLIAAMQATVMCLLKQ